MIGNNLTDESFTSICEILPKIQEQVTMWDAFDHEKRGRHATRDEQEQLQIKLQDPSVSVKGGL